MERQVTVQYALQKCAQLYLEKCSLEDENAQLRAENLQLKTENSKNGGDASKVETASPEVPD